MSSSVIPSKYLAFSSSQQTSIFSSNSAFNPVMSNTTQPPSHQLSSATLDITRGGETAVTLSQDLANALSTLQIQAQGFGNTDISDGIAEFGIIGGAANPTSAKVDIIHDGGLTLKSGNTTVNLTDFIINNLSGSNVLTGLVTINDNLVTRAPLFDLQGGEVIAPSSENYLNFELQDVDVKLTNDAANVLNQAFQVNAFTPGLNIGIADLEAQLIEPNQVLPLPPIEPPISSQPPFELLGTANNDLLAGIPGRDNIVFGFGGNDSVNTLFSGNDTIDLGDGDDSVFSGPGDDIIEGGAGSDFIDPGSGNNQINGGDGNDFLLGSEGSDQIRGGAGDDRIGGGAGPSRLFGESGQDNVFGSPLDDTVSGGADNDIVSGFIGNDLVFGDDGSDRLFGDLGNDLLFGGLGDDLLFGAFGGLGTNLPIGQNEVDVLIGNQGRDTFALGEVLPDGTELIFYNDRNPATTGTNDYGLIADFDSSDLIQLSGSADNYLLGASPSGLPSGAGIFLKDGTTPELLGIVADIAPTDLSLGNTNQFSFV
jgi:Ca2+-binding RTX toxin-like protein